MANDDLVHGSCLCRSVSWQLRKPFEQMSHCHCSMCRKSHGAPFATYVAADAASGGSYTTRRGHNRVIFSTTRLLSTQFTVRCAGDAAGHHHDESHQGALDEDFIAQFRMDSERRARFRNRRRRAELRSCGAAELRRAANSAFMVLTI
jgi:hypothetical protein